MANDKIIQMFDMMHFKEECADVLSDEEMDLINSYMNLYHIINVVLKQYPLLTKETDLFEKTVYEFLDGIFTYINKIYYCKDIKKTRALVILLLATNLILYDGKNHEIMLSDGNELVKKNAKQYKMILDYVMNNHYMEIIDCSNFRPNIIITFIEVNTNACKCINPRTTEIFHISEEDGTKAMNEGDIQALIELIHKDRFYI